MRGNRHRLAVKYALDRVAAALLLLTLSPLLFALFVSVSITMGRPILFRQQRLGLRRRPFELLKFRTMHEAAGLTDAERLTSFGCLLRRTGLDELPQLINILRGEMSFVGPRPLLVRYGPYFSAEEDQRHLLRPGITGWSQVHGRNQSPWDERLRRDVWYLRHRSLALDARILGRTLLFVLAGRGFEPAPAAVMRDLDAERCTGTSDPR
jgi:lipopolysaccharide/colanic/teichoic acid biosynthesis glycosyltransferase